MILIPATTGSNLLNLLPVAQEARRRELLGGIVAGESFQRMGSTALAEFEHVTHEKALRSWVGMGFLPQSLARASRRLKQLVEKIARYNPHYAKRVKQNFGCHLKLMVLSEGMSIAYQKLFSAWRPSFMLSTSDYWPVDFQCCWQARRMGIPTAILQHGAISNLYYWPTYHDVFIAWGETFREQLFKLGAPAERIRVLGMPASDDLFNRSGRTAGKPVRPGSPPVCLILSHTQDRKEEFELFEEFGKYLIEVVRSMPTIKWKVKLHPNEDDSFYRERAFSKIGQVEILPRDVSLEQAVEESDVVCTIRSTAGLQAMMLKKPLIVLALSTLTGPRVLWPEEGGGIYARNPDEFRNCFSRLTNENNFADTLLASQEKFLDKNFANRGKAASAIVDFIEKESLPHVSNIGLGT